MTFTKLSAIALLAVFSSTFTVEANISAECAAAIQELESEGALQSELGRLLGDFGNIVSGNDECDASKGLGSFDCNITFGEDQSAYSELCVARNGTVFEDQLKVDCSILFGATDIHMLLQQVPVCLPSACDLSSIKHEDINVTAMEEFKDTLRQGNCKVDGSSAVMSTLVGATGAVLVTLGTLAFM